MLTERDACNLTELTFLVNSLIADGIGPAKPRKRPDSIWMI
jgi:hypothetical protein